MKRSDNKIGSGSGNKWPDGDAKVSTCDPTDA